MPGTSGARVGGDEPHPRKSSSRWPQGRQALTAPLVVGLLERLTGSRGPVYFVHPEEVASVLRRAAAYPFSLGRGHFARHAPHVGCSCALCKLHKHDPARRAREARRWRSEWEEELP